MYVNEFYGFISIYVWLYNSQTKQNGTFRNVVLGICLLRKGTGILHQIYRFVCVWGGGGAGWGRLINGAINGTMLALF